MAYCLSPILTISSYPTSLVYLTLLLTPAFRARLGDLAFIGDLMRIGARHHETWYVPMTLDFVQSTDLQARREGGRHANGDGREQGRQGQEGGKARDCDGRYRDCNRKRRIELPRSTSTA